MDPITAFLLSSPATRGELIDGLATRLVEEGLPLERVWCGLTSIHPLLAGSSTVWNRGEGTLHRTIPIERRQEMGRLTGDDMIALAGSLRLIDMATTAPGTLGLAPKLWEVGFTQVALTTILAQDGRALAYVSFVTRAAFDGDHLARIESLIPMLTLALRLFDREQLVDVLARTYLGASAARRVLSGEIHRGDGYPISAAIWFSDLRGFSDLSERLSTRELLAYLDDAFEAQVGCIAARGGEVLKFIGDGLLAVFHDEDASKACAAALDAARALAPTMSDVNRRRSSAGRVEIAYGLALHHGEVMYGNIGAPDRLDFTVVGPAVNLAARLEGLCGRLGRELLLSEDFVRHHRGSFQRVGSFELKGVGEVAAFAGSGAA